MIIVPYSSPLFKRFRCYIFVHFSANKGPLCAWFHQAIITVIVITHYTEQSASSSILYVCVQRVSQFCFLQNVTMSFYGKAKKRGKFCTLLQSVQLLGMTQPLIVELGRVGFRAFYAQQKKISCFGLFICKILHSKPSIASRMNW